MKIQNLTVYLALFIISTISAQAQVLTEEELAVIASDQIKAFISDQKEPSHSLNGGPTWVTVGSDVACDYRLGTTKIQDAIDDGNIEIRIVEGNYTENIAIDDVDVKLLGGYANCTDADSNTYNSNSVATRIIPAAGSGRPAIRVTGNTQRNALTLRNLTIQRGENWGFYTGGGVAFLNADYNVSMNKLSIQQNNGLIGGGVSVLAGKTNIEMYNVQIASNTAPADAGGLYCSGADNSITFNSANSNSAATILNNTTDGNGGGAYITNGCTFFNYVGTGPAFDFRGIISNKAGDHGGGVYASAGAKVYFYGNNICTFFPVITCRGYSSEPVNLSSNIADDNNDNVGNGGAVYATGSTTAVYATNVRINNNSAYHGGGVAVDDGALFQTSTSYSGGLFFSNPTCWERGRCNQYTENKATESGGYGGAFYAENSGKLNVIRTHIEANRADFGSAFYLIDANSNLSLEGSYITGNGSATADGYSDNYPVRISTGASARIDYTTIADNHATTASLGNNSGSLQIYSSIVHDLSGADALKEFSPVVSTEDCLIVNALGDVSSSFTNIVDNPEFVDRGNNDYHINAALSPAVDYCDEINAQHTTQDTDQQDRGWDDYLATNNIGPFDVGADETYDNDIIFKDGLEQLTNNKVNLKKPRIRGFFMAQAKTVSEH